MIFNQPDYLRPIRDANRDEYILVEFTRVLKNTNMSLLRNLFIAAKNDSEILKLLPKLSVFANLNQDEQYAATVLFNYSTDFIYSLSNEKFTPKLCQQFADEFIEPYNFEYLHITRMETILRALADKDFVKKIYIFADKFTTEMKNYTARIFQDKGIGPNVKAIEGNLIDCLASIPEITTCFVSNTSDIIQSIEFDDCLLDDKLIIISDGYGNYIPTDDKKSFTYAHLDTFEKMKKEKKSIIAYAYPHCVNKAI